MRNDICRNCRHFRRELGSQKHSVDSLKDMECGYCCAHAPKTNPLDFETEMDRDGRRTDASPMADFTLVHEEMGCGEFVPLKYGDGAEIVMSVLDVLVKALGEYIDRHDKPINMEER